MDWLPHVLPLDLANWAMALSKAFQVILPILLFVGFRALPWRKRIFEACLRRFHPGAKGEQREEWLGVYERRVARLMGFLAWKIGCDLGFFLIVGQSWLRALTPAGLVPYVIVQYLLYRLLGQKMMLGGMWNPFGVERYQVPSLQRRQPGKHLLSKFLHENLNSTSVHVPLRRVMLKPFADYAAIIVAWSAYTMGIFFVQSGEINWHPLTDFPHAQMLAIYLGGIFAFIIGFNLGEMAISAAGPSLGWAFFHARLGTTGQSWMRALRWRLRPLVERGGLSLRWIVSATSGILMVALLTFILKDWVVHLTDNVTRIAFEHYGELPPVQRSQIQPVRAGAELPDFAAGVAAYRAIWGEPSE